MTDKMEMIESKVKGTVDTTVQTVKRTFDVKEQVREHPWVAFGAAVATGYVLGSLGGSSEPEPRRDYQRGEAVQYYSLRDDKHEREAHRNGNTSHNRNEQAAQEPGFFDSIVDQFGDELETMKTAAITAATTMLRDMIRQNLPQFAESYEKARRQRMPSDTNSDTDAYSEYSDTASPLDRELREPQSPGVGNGPGRESLYRS
jgi:hypothetical protein